MDAKEIAEVLVQTPQRYPFEYVVLAQDYLNLLAKLDDPTEEMKLAGEKHLDECRGLGAYIFAEDVFKAMIAEL